jgi:hypothetical protein
MCMPVLVLPVSLNRKISAKSEGRGGVLGLPSVRTPLIVFSN